MADLAISEVAARAGLRPSTLRYYEELGLLAAPRRRGGQRRYDADVFPRLAVIKLAREAGFQLAEIKTLLNGFSPRTPASRRWRKLAERKLPEVDALIARAQTMKRLLENLMECGCIDLDQCGLAAMRTDTSTAAPSDEGHECV